MKKVILLLSFLPILTFGYIVRFEKWQKDGKSVYLLADVHIQTPLAKIQQEELIAVAKTLPDAVLLAEDSFNLDPVWYREIYSSMKNIDNMIAKTIHDMELENNQKDQFLAYITRLFEKHGLRSCNAELRHLYRLWGEGQVGLELLAYTKNYLENQYSGYFSVKDIAWVSSLYENKDSLWDSFHGLLDAHFVLLMVKSLKNSSNVFVAAGSQHILPVRHYLESLGFKNSVDVGKNDNELEGLYQSLNENKIYPIDLATQFDTLRFDFALGEASSSSLSSLPLERKQEMQDRLLEDEGLYEGSNELTITDLLKRGTCPEIKVDNEMRWISFKGMGLTSLDGLKDVPGIECVGHIDLSGNKLSRIRYCDFQAMHCINKINLNDNQISRIEPFSFSSMLHIISLDLRNNLLEYLDQNVLTGPFFSRIYLQRNKIQNVPLNLSVKFAADGDNELFINLESNPVMIDLKNSLSIESEHNVQIKCDVSVKQLFNNDQVQVEKRGDEIYLSLNGRGLSSLDGLKDIPNIKSVTVLDLSGNNLKLISKDDFPEIDDLKLIDLSGNGLTSIPRQCFASFGHVETLNLCGNKIYHLYQDSFNGPTIGKLWLSENCLVSLPKEMSVRMQSKNLHKKCEVMLTRNRFKDDPTSLLKTHDMDEDVLSRIYVDEELKKVTFKNGIQQVNIKVTDGAVVKLELEDLLEFDFFKNFLESKYFNIERFLQLSKNRVQRSQEEDVEYDYGYNYLKETLPLMFNEQSICGGMDKNFLEFFFKVLKVSRDTPSDIESMLQSADPAVLVDMCCYSDRFFLDDLRKACIQVAAKRFHEIAAVEKVDEKLHGYIKNKILCHGLPFERPVKFNFISPDNKFKFYKNYILHWQNFPKGSYYDRHYGRTRNCPARVIGSIFERSSCALIDRFEALPFTRDMQLSPDGKNIVIDSKIVSPLKKQLMLGEQNGQISFENCGDECLIGPDVRLNLIKKTITFGDHEENVPELDRGEIEQVNWHQDHNILQIILKENGQLLYSFEPNVNYNYMEQTFGQIAQQMDGTKKSYVDDSRIAASST